MKRKDITGLRSGHLVAVMPLRAERNGVIWLLRCDCGNEIERRTGDYVYGAYTSCGCQRVTRAIKMGYKNAKHGEGHGHKTPEYRCWTGMKERCYNPNNTGYRDYGAKGVVVCDRWRNDYLTFLSDMGRRPPGMTLDRLDPAGPYAPHNCRWATPTEQQRNKRASIYVVLDGKRMPALAAAEQLGITKIAFHYYLRVRRAIEGLHELRLD